MKRRSRRSKVAEAVEARRSGDAPRAIEILGEVLGADESDAVASVEMARALRVMGDPAEAEVFYRAALKEVLDYVAVCELAAVVAEQDRISEAEELVEAALAMADGNPRLDPGEALLVRAAIEIGRGRADRAEEALSKIVRKRARKPTLVYAERLREKISQLQQS